MHEGTKAEVVQSEISGGIPNLISHGILNMIHTVALFPGLCSAFHDFQSHRENTAISTEHAHVNYVTVFASEIA